MDQVMSVAGRITYYTRIGANIEEGKKLLALSLKETEEKNLIVLYYAGIFCSSPTVADYKAASTYLSKALELFPNSEFKSNTGLKDAMAKMKADAEKKIK